MKFFVSLKAEKQLSKLPQRIQKKTHRQFSFLILDYRHPSLFSRKMGGGKIYEARIDIHYRFTFQIEDESIYILTIGPHDEGLGKK